MGINFLNYYDLIGIIGWMSLKKNTNLKFCVLSAFSLNERRQTS